MSKFYLLFSFVFCNLVSISYEEERIGWLEQGFIVSFDEQHLKENDQIGKMFTSSLYKAFFETRCLLPACVISSLKHHVRPCYSWKVLLLLGMLYTAAVSAFDVFLVPRIKHYYYKKALLRALHRRNQEVIVE